MNKLAIIGGTGLTSLENLEIIQCDLADTPYGKPSTALIHGVLNNHSTEVIFLARHGTEHTIPPHKVNYRANLWALKEAGVTDIIAINAVGGIANTMSPSCLVIPDQIIDYTTKRINTFFENNLQQVTHIDFSYPYSQILTQLIWTTAREHDIKLIKGGTYAATEGPRLETAAEIQRLKQDGCDIVGMTGMPEAALARELALEYASICVNANWAAGLSDQLITMTAIEKNLTEGLQHVRQLLSAIIHTY
jgi:5'-deoxy-5'-methylthioadenosine phosphorylase